MATIKSYTDLSQSKTLSKILPLESADYCWGIDDETLHYNNSPYPCAWKDYTCKEYYIPCWSLASLLGAFPEGYTVELTRSFNGIDYYCNIDGEPLLFKADNPIDACVDMVMRLNELNLL